MTTRREPPKPGMYDHLVTLTPESFHDVMRGAQRALHVTEPDAWRVGQIAHLAIEENNDKPYLLARVTHVLRVVLPAGNELNPDELEEYAVVSINLGLGWSRGE